MKHRLATPYVFLSVSLLSILAGCHVLVDEMIANSTMSEATGKNASNANDSRNNSRNSNRRGGKVVRSNPSGRTPIVYPISDVSTPPPPPTTTPSSPPADPPSSGPLLWTGSGTPVTYNSSYTVTCALGTSCTPTNTVYKDGKYYKPKNLGSAGTVPTDQGNNGNEWKRVNPDGSDYLQTGIGNATPYDANTTYNDPAPPTGQNYYVTYNNKLWKLHVTYQISPPIDTTPGSSIFWTEITAPTTPFPLTDSLGNTLGTIDATTGNRVLTIPPGTTVIRDNAFKDKNLYEVVIPPGVTAIGKGAFEGNADLSSVTIPNSVTHIKDNAFKGTDLSSVTIPTSVTSIGNGAFMGAELSSVTFSTPSSVTSIGNNAFKNTDLTSVTIPTSVTSIGNGAFMGTALTSVTFSNPSSLTSTSIGTGAFSGITTLTTVTLSQALLDRAPVNAFPGGVTFQDDAIPPNTITRTP